MDKSKYLTKKNTLTKVNLDTNLNDSNKKFMIKLPNNFFEINDDKTFINEKFGDNSVNSVNSMLFDDTFNNKVKIPNTIKEIKKKNSHSESIKSQNSSDYDKVIKRKQEVLCDDHTKHNKGKELAHRYCEKCNIFICKDCALEYHFEHANYARLTVESCFNSKGEEINCFIDKINRSNFNLKISKMRTELEEIIIEKDNRTNKSLNKLKELKEIIDNIIRREEEVSENLTRQVKELYNILIIKNINGFNRNYNELQERSKSLENDWNQNLSYDDKVLIIKENCIGELKEEFSNYEMDFVKIEKEHSQLLANLNDIMKKTSIDLNYSDEYKHIDEELCKIHIKISNFNVDIHKNYLENKKLNRFNFNLIEESLSNNKIVDKPRVEEKKVELQKNIENHFNYNHIFNFDIQNNNQFSVYDCEDKITTNYVLSQSLFSNKDNFFSKFPIGMKYVNLGDQVLITGGADKQILSDKCILLSIDCNNKVTIDEFAPMIIKRFSHNIIFIPDRELVFVCGGKNIIESELVNLSIKMWSQAPNLKQSRANACLAYINRKYIYCISGYDNNNYLNSCEYFDLDSYNKEWVLILFDSIQIEYRISAPGIIHLGDNKVLLCGGLVNDVYTDKIYELSVNEKNVPKIILQQLKIPDTCTIFIHNSFCRNDSLFHNYDVFMDIYIYDCEKKVIIKKI